MQRLIDVLRDRDVRDSWRQLGIVVLVQIALMHLAG